VGECSAYLEQLHSRANSTLGFSNYSQSLLLHTSSLQLKMLRLTLVLVLIACVGQIIGVPLNQAHQNELKAFKAMLEKSEKAKKTEGTNESRVGPGGEPPKFMSVEGWKDCMESKDMGSWDAWCLPAQKPKSNKCLEKSWKELQHRHMGAMPCGGPGTIESGVGPQHPKDGYTLVEGWKDCMVQWDKGLWCLPAHRPKSNKCLEKTWKELQGPHMGTVSCAGLAEPCEGPCDGPGPVPPS